MEQAVVEKPDDESQQTQNEGENAQGGSNEPSLDDLLKEFETPEKAEPTKPDDLDEIRQFMSQMKARDIQTGVTEAASEVKKAAGDVAKNIPDYLMEGALHREAARNPAIERAFNERFSKPNEWKKIITTLGKKIAGDLQSVDKAGTEGWDAVQSAMHSASTSNKPDESPPDLSNMTDAEFAAYKRSLG